MLIHMVIQNPRQTSLIFFSVSWGAFGNSKSQPVQTRRAGASAAAGSVRIGRSSQRAGNRMAIRSVSPLLGLSFLLFQVELALLLSLPLLFADLFFLDFHLLPLHLQGLLRLRADT